MVNDRKTVVKTQRATRPAVSQRRNFQDVAPEQPARRKLVSAVAAQPSPVTSQPAQRQHHRVRTRNPKAWLKAQRLSTIRLVWQPRQWVYLSLGLFALVSLTIIGTTMHGRAEAKRYVLSSATQHLVGTAAPGLNTKISYDTKLAKYRYNPSAADGIKPNANAAGDNAATIGGSNYYGVDLAKVAKNGQTFTDAQTKLSFSLVPQFGALDGKRVDGHIVYPVDAGQAVYTLKDNGLKEDVVLSKPTNAVSLKYKLQLPDTLQAKLEADGSIGIYSADPALFGNISYGSSTDQTAVQKARTSAKKNNLVFQIPAPVITETGKATSTGTAKFILNGNDLTVAASSLSNLSYPISIDPSVVIQSANSFTTGNNEDNNASISTGSVARGPLTGGTVGGGWTTAGASSSLPTAQYGVTSVIYNGIVYVYGGANNGTSTNQIYYATLGSNGTIGAWTTASVGTIGSSVPDQAFVTYNGYLYIFGGQSGSGSGRALVQAEYYAAICTGKNTTTVFTGTNCNPSSSAGSISSWKSLEATSPWGPRDNVAATAYNGYMYLVGGCTSVNAPSAGNCKTGGTDTWAASINADGTLGTWTAQAGATPSAGMTNLRYGETLSAYNGYLYIAGGCIINTSLSLYNCDTFSTDVSHAPISSSGAVGAWVTDSALLIGRQGPVAVYSGYLYMAGGCTGQNCSSIPATDAEYAQINANGTLSPWRTTSVVTTAGTPARLRQAGFAYNGYLYEIGGCTAASGQLCSSTGNIADAISAKIDAPGTLGTILTTTNFDSTNGWSQLAAVASNGYLYLLGGSTNSTGNPQPTVRYAPINSTDGTVGTWTTTNPLGVARFSGTAIANNGTIYMIGGQNGSDATNCPSGYCNNIETASINASTGALTWSGTKYVYSTSGVGSQVGGRGKLSAAIQNGYLYVVGGTYNNNSTDSTEVDYAVINANGTLGSFAPTTAALTAAVGMHTGGAYSWGGRIYAVGNRGSAVVEYATPQANGDITAWSTTGGNDFILAAGGLQEYAVAMDKGMLYITGGLDLSNNPGKMYQAAIQANGTVGPWALLAQPLSTSKQTHVALGYAGYLYVIGGSDSSLTPTYYKTVEYYPINNGGNGAGAGWKDANASINGGSGPSFSNARDSFGTVVYNGYLYVMGGNSYAPGHAPLNDVQYAKINTNGSLGSWQTTTSLNIALDSIGTAVSNGYIYVVGGFDGSTSQNVIQYAKLSSTGAINGSWTTLSGAAGLTTGRTNPGTFASNSYLYAVGGAGLASTEYAPINANGTLGSWQTTTSLPAASNGTVTTDNGYVYSMGGFSGSALITVVYAPINANGTLGSWQTTTSLPQGRSNFTALVYNGYMYVMGGLGSSLLNSVVYAPINANGTLGSWQTTTSFTSARYNLRSTVSNGYLYVVGGSDGTNEDGDVQFTPLQSIAHISHYSKLIDLAGGTSNPNSNPQLTRTGFNGTGTANDVSYCSTFGTAASPALGSQICNIVANFGIPIANKGYGRYDFVNLTIDDSQNAAFPDVSPTTVTELDAYFHAAPAQRLRGGQTFTTLNSGSAVTNQLDTEGP